MRAPLPGPGTKAVAAGDAPSDNDRIHLDAALSAMVARAESYLRAGVPVHFGGPAGMGKTTLALFLARRIGRPVTLVTGDATLDREDLVGREVGFSTSRMDDRFSTRVHRVETRARVDWRPGPLFQAMQEGHVLVYDEFARTSPQTNAVFLSALEERRLVTIHPAAGRQQITAHPDFRVILTSNTHGYAGVQAVPDALTDRMVTFRLDALPPETEAAIVAAASGIASDAAARIVTSLAHLRSGAQAPAMRPSLRTAILVARLCQATGVAARASEPGFLQILSDVLCDRVEPDRLHGHLTRLAGEPADADPAIIPTEAT
ncbi:MAG: AAA family ATPase [Rhodobacteraceae bacterium]|jgi:gas vesicle protein GvpN|nr:AAA family ATPase [Paracoccaceae bacterium]